MGEQNGTSPLSLSTVALSKPNRSACREAGALADNIPRPPDTHSLARSTFWSLTGYPILVCVTCYVLEEYISVSARACRVLTVWRTPPLTLDRQRSFQLPFLSPYFLSHRTARCRRRVRTLPLVHVSYLWRARSAHYLRGTHTARCLRRAVLARSGRALDVLATSLSLSQSRISLR